MLVRETGRGLVQGAVLLHCGVVGDVMLGVGLEGGEVVGGDHSESCPSFISSPGRSSGGKGWSWNPSSPRPTARDSTTVRKVSTSVPGPGVGAPVPGGPGAGALVPRF